MKRLNSLGKEGVADARRPARLAGRYARMLHLVPSNSWIIRPIQTFSDIRVLPNFILGTSGEANCIYMR